ncbi:YSC84-related protein [Haliea salexigens]|uniref:YSC84-related protein n=1 Tax=Haliea salexigens TaxID=287487 RepID=UPI00042298AC|nr:YSC84-related protein [Haliea salexigens]|tara:strand:- start:4491 stop:5066 length:576 start_codon:yes stop_codon:yes gene_type:complete
MKKIAVMPILYVLLALVLAPLARADNYAEALESFRDAGESAAYFDSAYGYALFPTIGKGGIGIGGAHGKGRVYRQGNVIGEATMTQLTVGFQLGGQAFSQIIFFESANALEQFTSGNFEFGAQATAVAITAGVSAEASTGGGVSAGVSGGRNDASTASLGYRKGMAVFTIAKGGLMYEATLGGQKFNFTPN